MGGRPCASALCANLVIWFSLHFVVGLDHVSVAGWYHEGFTLYVLLLCARDVTLLRRRMLWGVSWSCPCSGSLSNCCYRININQG